MHTRYIHLNQAYIVFLLCWIFFTSSTTYAQQLDSIATVGLAAKQHPPSDLFFLLTASDFTLFRGKTSPYLNSLQIIDANDPWPPIWYMPMRADTSLGLPFAAMIPLNASIQNNQLNFYSKWRGKDNTRKDGFVFVNDKLFAIDTLSQTPLEIDNHDLKLSRADEFLYFVKKDTNLPQVISDKKSHTLTKYTTEVIQVADRSGKVVFEWDPLLHLGLESEYEPYRALSSSWYKHEAIDWSHGNSLAWDEDGNILYSYRYIGIGKIDRLDGHVIWRIDRKKQRINTYSDSIPFFLQHDIQSFTDKSGNHLYSIWSNGDKSFKHPTGLVFSVSDTLNNQHSVKLWRVIDPNKSRKGTDSGGNLDIDPDGGYLVNYGRYNNDTIGGDAFFEYRDSHDSLICAYTIPAAFFSYRVHKIAGWHIDRPQVIEYNGTLSASTPSQEITWYQLPDTNLKQIKKVRNGKTYAPVTSGKYCAVVKMGIGYATSKPINIIKTK